MLRERIGCQELIQAPQKSCFAQVSSNEMALLVAQALGRLPALHALEGSVLELEAFALEIIVKVGSQRMVDLFVII